MPQAAEVLERQMEMGPPEPLAIMARETAVAAGMVMEMWEEAEAFPAVGEGEAVERTPHRQAAG